MAAQRYLILREGYVINTVIIDLVATPDYVYPMPHDLVLADNNENVGIGDWYEEAEGIFYRPLSTPTDLPTELQ